MMIPKMSKSKAYRKKKATTKKRTKTYRARVKKSDSKKKRRTQRRRKQRGGDWGIINSIRGIQYNLVKLGNGFMGQPTSASSNPYPTEGQYSR